MSNTILTITLTPRVRASLLEQAVAQQISLERHASEVLTRHVRRPEWHEVAASDDRAALAAEVERLTAERDRARATAIRIWSSMGDEVEAEPGRRPKHHVGLQELLAGTGEVLQIAVDVLRPAADSGVPGDPEGSWALAACEVLDVTPGDVHTVTDGSRWVVTRVMGESLELEYIGTADQRSWSTSVARLAAQTTTRRRARSC